MVRKRDQIIYKLSDNVSVSSIGEEKHKQLMTEIEALHKATMAAAAKATNTTPPRTDITTKVIAPKQDAIAATIPGETSTADAEALQETARKLREELEQQQRQQQHQLQRQQEQYSSPQPPSSQPLHAHPLQAQPLHARQQQPQPIQMQPIQAQPSQAQPQTQFRSNLSGMPEVKATRKYVKTGKYSKKRQQQQQQQQQQHQQHEQQQQQPQAQNHTQGLTQQQLLALQQSLQAASNTTMPVGMDANAAAPNTLNTAKPFVLPSNQMAMKPILTKRLPEEELHHLEIKRRFNESLASDHKAVTQPDYETPFSSLKDAIDRLLPYHIYQYPKGDLNANKIPMELQDKTMLEIFKCQTDLFEKYATVIKKIANSEASTPLKILIERQLLADQRQLLTEEQAKIAAEQAAQQQEMLRLQAEQARLAASQQPAPPTTNTG
ncbi:uncharacterized protein BYT42DRAFT_593729 [Radiomyces spectabilis]|uniref:uncharacterized protein n=1 Tax=Radiomyces spectabilis TaxID=64574 RepID=UPI0022203F13|nr:uncharacterized protein BYT42DRAFT_593729 [Radiomyces spectabilis]KAI8377396.1 hypothetical protein BYT42DRAFT_593729 [Radiomyces spectabilis]